MAVEGGRRRQKAAEVAAVCALALVASANLTAQDTTVVRTANDSLSVRFVDADIRGVIQALGRYLPKPVLVGNLQPVKVSLETPAPVPRGRLRELLKGLVESQNLEFAEDSAFFRISPGLSHPPPSGGGAGGPGSPAGTGGQGGGPVQLFVIRLKHARAADVAATVNLLFGAGGEFSGRAGLSAPTLSDELRRNVVPPAGAPDGSGCAWATTSLGGEVSGALWARHDRAGRTDELALDPSVPAGL